MMAGLSFWRRLESAHPTAMKKGILNETDGWDIFHNGANRTFRDIEQVAIDSAIYGKKCASDRVQVRCRADGSLREIMPDVSVNAVQSLVLGTGWPRGHVGRADARTSVNGARSRQFAISQASRRTLPPRLSPPVFPHRRVYLCRGGRFPQLSKIFDFRHGGPDQNPAESKPSFTASSRHRWNFQSSSWI